MSDVVSVKKQKIEVSRAMSSDVIVNADECVRALEQALEAMEPLDVFAGILRLIAGFVPYVRFNAGSGLDYFTISDDGATATRNLKDAYGWQFVCASPDISEGVREATFRINKGDYGIGIGVGVVPISKASSSDGAQRLGYMLYDDGCYFEKFSDTYGEGDTVTVRLDLDANTVTFRKNGNEAIGSPQTIEHGAYYFTFDSDTKDNAVTVVSME